MSRVVASTRVVDRGWDKAIATQTALGGRGVKVGIQAGAGKHDGVDLLDILIFNEFGTGRIPARPVMRSYADTYAADIYREAENVGTFILRTGIIDPALQRMGAFMQSGLQAHWRASKSWASPNAKYTIAMKGSDVPLIDNGVLINAVRWSLT